MKKVYYSILTLALFCLYPSLSQAGTLPTEPTDTITIQIGNSKKIIIWVEDKEDLSALQQYDINKMIQELSETVDSLDHANQILIISDENGERYKIEIAATETDSTWFKSESDTTTRQEDNVQLGIHFNSKDKPKRNHFKTRHYMEFDLGMNNYLDGSGEFPDANNEQHAVRPWGSWYVGINSNFRTHISGPLALQWGAGVDWYNFKFADDRTRIERLDDGIQFIEDPNTEINHEKSKLTAAYVNVNLVPMLDFRYKTKWVTDDDGKRRRIRTYRSRAFRVGLGGYAGYRIASYTKYKYDDGNTRRDRDHNNFFMNNWRYGMRMQVGFRGVDLFANYDLNELFSTNRGPQLHAFSFGITL